MHIYLCTGKRTKRPTIITMPAQSGYYHFKKQIYLGITLSLMAYWTFYFFTNYETMVMKPLSAVMNNMYKSSAATNTTNYNLKVNQINESQFINLTKNSINNYDRAFLHQSDTSNYKAKKFMNTTQQETINKHKRVAREKINTRNEIKPSQLLKTTVSVGTRNAQDLKSATTTASTENAAKQGALHNNLEHSVTRDLSTNRNTLTKTTVNCSKIWVSSWKGGRLGNQMCEYAHLLVLHLEYGVQVSNHMENCII